MGDVETVIRVLGEPEGDDNLVLRGAGLDGTHLRGIDDERIFDVLSREDRVDRTSPNPSWIAWNES